MRVRNPHTSGRCRPTISDGDAVTFAQARLTINLAPPRQLANARDFAFDALLASNRLVQPVLDADRETIDRFFARVTPVLESRLSDAITATASIIVSALKWYENIGKK